MKKGGKGGGKTVTGKIFETRSDIVNYFQSKSHYTCEKDLAKAGYKLLHRGKLVARIFKQREFGKFLKEQSIDWKEHISKELRPDSALLVIVWDTLFIIEMKYQQTEGSVDEKLQTCDFKRKQYQKLRHPLGIKVEYVYILNKWFRKAKYKDVLDYIHSVNCHYLFDDVPLKWFGLPED